MSGDHGLVDSAVSCRDPYNGDTERVASDAKAWNERGGMTVYLLWAVTDAGTRLINVFSTRDRAMVESDWYAGDSFVQPATAVPHEGGTVTGISAVDLNEMMAQAFERGAAAERERITNLIAVECAHTARGERRPYYEDAPWWVGRVDGLEWAKKAVLGA